MTDRRVLPFVKMHGLGNDFAIFDARIENNRRQNAANAVELDDCGRHRLFSVEQIIRLCDRHLGIGCDQIIVLHEPSSNTATETIRSNVTAVRMQIINVDGREVEACGNATRCVALLTHDLMSGLQVPFSIESVAGLLEVKAIDAVARLVSVDMGVVSTVAKNIPMQSDDLDQVMQAHDGFLKEKALKKPIAGERKRERRRP
jgi:diaminopimelate epimerase